MKQSLTCLLVAAMALLPAAGAFAQPSSAEPAKTEVKKKPVAKGAEPKKPAAKRSAPAKGAPSKAQPARNVTVYTNTPPPALKDKDGNVIPVTPEAYDVSSALPKKK